MDDWWSYRLGSFLLFSESTYQRLLSGFNADWWPLQVVLAGLMLALMGLLGLLRWPRQHAAVSGRWQQGSLWLALAAAWAWSAWSFLMQRFVAINWSAEYLAWVMGLQAVALCIAAGLPGRAERGNPGRTGLFADGWGLGLTVTGLLAYPLISAGWGQDWRQAHSFGLLPEPTAVTTLGLLLLAQRAPWWLWPVPLLLCLWSGLWLWALTAPAAWLAPASAGYALALALARACVRRQH